MEDGLCSIILGSYITQLAAGLTLLFFIQKPPTYDEDEEKTRRAKWLFSFLVLFHLGLMIFKFCLTFLNQSLWDKMSYLTFAVIITIVII